VLLVSGSEAVIADGPQALVGFTVFLADESLAKGFQAGLPRGRVEAVAGQRGFAWMASDGDLTTLVHDDEGRVTSGVDLASGLVIAPGSVVDSRDPSAVTIRGAAGQPEVTLGLRGGDTGLLRYSATTTNDAWVRYFFAAEAPAMGLARAFEGIRFRLFDPAEIAANHQFDPARPFDPARSRAVPSAGDTRVSTFRTRWDGAVVLTSRPPDSSYVYAFDPEAGGGYITLDGVWDWSVGDPSPDKMDLLPGAAGGEYVKVPAGFVVRFVADAPAFAHAFDPSAAAAARATGDTFPLSRKVRGLPDVTTAWVYAEPAPSSGPVGLSAGYYSQPTRAALFLPAPTDDFMRAVELESVALPAEATTPDAPQASFPAVPYAGLETAPTGAPAGSLDRVRRFENEVLTPARTQAIDDLVPTRPQPQPAANGPTGPTAVTPQGLLSTFSPDYSDWRSLVLAQAHSGQQQLRYADIQPKLRSALLAPELFLVVSDAAKLCEQSSTRYSITSETLDLAAHPGKVPAEALDLVKAAGLVDRVYDTAAELTAVLTPALTPTYEKFEPTIRTYAELMELNVAGWTFDFAGWRWATGTRPTMLVIKFADGDFESLVEDRSRWTFAGDFNPEGGKVAQDRLKAIVADARARQETEPELQPFVNTVLASGTQAWNGVIWFDVAAPLNQFPPDLQALAVGIPATELRAHHIGVTLSAFEVTAGRIALSDSSIFGLILYEDHEDLVYKGDAYDFKVLALKVRFANSTIAAFSSQVELLVGRLFAELAALVEYGLHGPNNIVLDGTLQHGAYRFASATRYHFAINSSVVDFVAVDRAVFVTLVQQTTQQRVAAQFALEGAMGFKRLGDFDLFGFGPSEPASDSGQLALSNLIVAMEFDPADPQASRKLTFVAGQAAFDPARSRARSGSLPRRFPLQVAAMREGAPGPSNGTAPPKVATPADLGFIPVESPLTPGSLGPTWFGLELALSFGSPGGLAAQAGFTGALLASWAPSDEGYDVALGLRLPGSQGGRKSMTIMGPLNLSIGRLSFLYDSDTSGYLLLLQNIALSFLGLSFPPGGKVNATLFGNPDPSVTTSALGWYAAFKKDDEQKPKELSWPR
jgi:hypothetical protein